MPRGRPKLNDPRTESIIIRVTRDEKDAIERASGALSVADWIRRVIFFWIRKN